MPEEKNPVPPADVPAAESVDKWGPCAAWAAGPNPCGKPASDPVHRGHPFITRVKYNAVRVRDGLPPIEFPADVPAATPTDWGTHVCKNGSQRDYAAILCSLCRPDEVPIVPAATSIQTPVVEWCADRERMRRALAAEPESLSIGQLNQAVRDLREDNYQLRLKLQDATPAAVQVESESESLLQLLREARSFVSCGQCGCGAEALEKEIDAAILRATAAPSPTEEKS